MFPRNEQRRLRPAPFCLFGDKLHTCGQIRQGVKAMFKTSIVTGVLAVMAFSPAYAQDLCNDAHMKQMDAMIAKMTDASKKTEATAALDMSKAAMKKGDTAECMKHMQEAHKAMGL
jgi:capsule polysaccharide export protein KpsE/RkpR